MFTATLYVPSQTAQLLTTAQLAKLGICQAPQLIADENAVASLLCVLSVDLLANTDTAAVYGLADADDYDTRPNPEAEQAVYGALGEQSELSGPVLVIEQTTSQTEPEASENAPQFFPRTSQPEQYDEADAHWPAYHERAGRNY